MRLGCAGCAGWVLTGVDTGICVAESGREWQRVPESREVDLHCLHCLAGSTVVHEKSENWSSYDWLAGMLCT